MFLPVRFLTTVYAHVRTESLVHTLSGANISGAFGQYDPQDFFECHEPIGFTIGKGMVIVDGLSGKHNGPKK